MGQPRRFQVILIKPSHYDDDGYVVQWLRSSIPSNSLAVVHALAADAAQRQVLGPDVEIDITSIDETNSRVRAAPIVERIAAHGGFGMVGLVGVQSNQFPRALDIARPLREAGIQVVIGGFHVSGCLAMLPEMQADLKVARDMGLSLYAGEAEGRFDELLLDAANGSLRPIYDYLKDLPGIESAVTPILPTKTISRTFNSYSSFDAGRGCPFQCSFCTIINVQGRKSRYRSADDVERLVRDHWALGIRRFFITDDNLARNKNWEAILDRLIMLRERDRIDLRLLIQVDTLCYKIPNFVEKCARAGVSRVFIGLENINPANLMAAKKRQNKITEYRQLLLAWKQVGVITYAGYILGFPADTPESIREDISIIKRELPIDILEFFCLTPLPGSEDHKVLTQKGVPMDPDMNKYDLEHVVADHPKMSREEWSGIYNAAWDAYYTDEHIDTILRRAAASGMGLSRLSSVLFFFAFCMPLEKVHPLQAGVFRLKFRRDRRPGMPIEPLWSFYPKYVADMTRKHVLALKLWLDMQRRVKRIKKDPERLSYTDVALTPVTDADTETLDLFKHNDGARNAVDHARKVAALTRTAPLQPATHLAPETAAQPVP